MPVAPMLPLLQSQLANVMKLKQAGTPDSAAAILVSAISQTISPGLLAATPPIPTPPIGAPLSLSLFRAAFNYGMAAQSNLTAQKVADGVKAIAPNVPPTGYALLLTQLQQAFNLKQAGTPESFATLAAGAIIAYFTAGLVI